MQTHRPGSAVPFWPALCGKNASATAVGGDVIASPIPRPAVPARASPGKAFGTPCALTAAGRDRRDGGVRGVGMYIGLGTVVVILLIVLVFMMLRRR